jgi:hypothetical protein
MMLQINFDLDFMTRTPVEVRDQCTALLERLRNPEAVPLPPLLRVSAPDLTPPGFDVQRLRIAAHLPRSLAQAVTAGLKAEASPEFEAEGFRKASADRALSPDAVHKRIAELTSASRERAQSLRGKRATPSDGGLPATTTSAGEAAAPSGQRSSEVSPPTSAADDPQAAMLADTLAVLRGPGASDAGALKALVLRQAQRAGPVPGWLVATNLADQDDAAAAQASIQTHATPAAILKELAAHVATLHEALAANASGDVAAASAALQRLHPGNEASHSGLMKALFQLGHRRYQSLRDSVNASGITPTSTG